MIRVRTLPGLPDPKAPRRRAGFSFGREWQEVSADEKASAELRRDRWLEVQSVPSKHAPKAATKKTTDAAEN